MTSSEFKLPVAAKDISFILNYNQTDPEMGSQIGSMSLKT
jgi:hypothetical protein